MKSFINENKKVVLKFPCYMIFKNRNQDRRYIILATSETEDSLRGIVVASDEGLWPIGTKSDMFTASSFEPFVGSFTVECP